MIGPAYNRDWSDDGNIVVEGLHVDDLVQRLANGDHPVKVGGMNPTLEELRQRVEEMGYVLIKFTGTRGGTELSVRLDRAATDFSSADFAGGRGTVHIEGPLILNNDPVRCVADIDLATLEGTGRVVPIEKSELARAD
jgi:hypothetical protein